MKTTAMRRRRRAEPRATCHFVSRASRLVQILPRAVALVA